MKEYLMWKKTCKQLEELEINNYTVQVHRILSYAFYVYAKMKITAPVKWS